jgi:hypothetical protein
MRPRDFIKVIAIFVTVVTATAWSMGENPRVLAERSAHLKTIEMETDP